MIALLLVLLLAVPAAAQPEVIERSVDWTPRPATGYAHVPEAGALPPIRLHIRPGAGWNQSTTGNDGRTGVPAVYIETQHDGQGDGGGITIICRMGGAPRGAPLSNPACFLLNGQVDAQGPGVYLNPVEIVLDDYGHANVSGAGFVVRSRYVGPVNDPRAFRFGLRSQSTGKPIGAHLSGHGPARVGVDLSGLDSDDRASVVMRRGDCLYYSGRPGEQPQIAADFGLDATCVYDYEAGYHGVITIVDGSPALQVQRWGVAVEGGLANTGDVYLLGLPPARGGPRALCIDATGRVMVASGRTCE